MTKVTREVTATVAILTTPKNNDVEVTKVWFLKKNAHKMASKRLCL